MTIPGAFRIASGSGASWTALGMAAGTTTGRWQDKSAHGALWSGGCFCSCFRRVPHRAAPSRTVRPALIIMIFLIVLRRAGFLHVR